MATKMVSKIAAKLLDGLSLPAVAGPFHQKALLFVVN